MTITGPTSVQVTVVEESHVRVDVRGIEVVDTRTTPEPFTATATVKNIRRDGAPVQIEGIQWQTAAVTDGDGIPIPGLITAEGNLLDRAVILGGTSGGGPNRYLVDGVITVPIAGLPDGDYAFTLSTSIS